MVRNKKMPSKIISIKDVARLAGVSITTVSRVINNVGSVKEENRITRRLVVTTAISLMIGFTAVAVAIFFGFAKLQTSWIQTVISFVGKTIVK